ncbi:hypothetical protein DID88_002533 [Monilinia fructigena]|uniref:Uncharacterized protein n=1 Tax=Monilinia fructigena TaxID=38457 RepID=A0A395IPM1_9HELO|nr:hypothetical protein DID88_002533 [Monilinia fructigena]
MKLKLSTYPTAAAFIHFSFTLSLLDADYGDLNPNICMEWYGGRTWFIPAGLSYQFLCFIFLSFVLFLHDNFSYGSRYRVIWQLQRWECS